GELTRGDDALGLVSDVEQDLIAVDLDDRSLDDVAVVEELQGLLDRGQEVLSRSDVVDCDLLGGRGGRCASHVVGCPCRWKLGPRRPACQNVPRRMVWDCDVTKACGCSPRSDTPDYQIPSLSEAPCPSGLFTTLRSPSVSRLSP